MKGVSSFLRAILPKHKNNPIVTPSGFMNLATNYGAVQKVQNQIRDYIKATKGPEDRCGYLNMAFLVDDKVFNSRNPRRPDRYFEVLLTFNITLISENFVTGEKEEDLHIIYEQAKELSRRQYKKLLYHFKKKGPADKTMRLFKAIVSSRKEPVR